MQSLLIPPAHTHELEVLISCGQNTHQLKSNPVLMDT